MNDLAVNGSVPHEEGPGSQIDDIILKQQNLPEIHFEIERRFLIDPSNPLLAEIIKSSEQTKIKQWYLLSADPGSENRIRMSVTADSETHFEFQHKEGHGVSRKETPPLKLSMEEALRMLEDSGAEGDPVEKIRYVHNSGGFKIEINRFTGVHSGLWTAEVEFPSPKDAQEFTPPEYFGSEVSENPEFESRSLAQSGLPKSYRHQAISNIFYGKQSMPAAEALPLLTELLVSNVADMNGNPVFLFIGAPSAAGKGWITDRLKEAVEKRLGEGSLTILSTDRYFKGASFNAALTKERRVKAEKLGLNPDSVKAVTFDDIEGIDFEQLKKDVLLMQNTKSGNSTDVPVYSFDSGERTGTESFTAGKIVIVEGLYALSDLLNDCEGMRVFINANEITRLIRRLSRDALERGFMNPGEQFNYHISAIRPTVDCKIIPTAANADLIIESNLDPVAERAHVPANRSERQIKVNGVPTDSAFTRLHGTAENSLSQFDRYLIHPEDSNAAEPNYLRLRFINDDRARAVCTYKWPSLDDGTERSILSFPVDTVALNAIEEIFTGGEELILAKNRTTWKIPVEGGSVYVNADTDISRIERDGTAVRLPSHSEFIWDPHIKEEVVHKLISTIMPQYSAKDHSRFPYLQVAAG